MSEHDTRDIESLAASVSPRTAETPAERTARRVASIKQTWEANIADGNDDQLLPVAKVNMAWLLRVAERLEPVQW